MDLPIWSKGEMVKWQTYNEIFQIQPTFTENLLCVPITVPEFSMGIILYEVGMKSSFSK